MLNTTRIGFFSALAAVIAFIGLSVENAAAQLNEKKVERDATGIYKGGTTAGTVTNKQDGVPQYTHDTTGGEGKMRIPVKDGKLRSTLNDEELPTDKNKFTGSEKKSDVRRNGKKIGVVANGKTTDGVHDPIKGKIRGKLVLRGGKWVANVKLTGEQDNGGGNVDCYKSKAKAKH